MYDYKSDIRQTRNGCLGSSDGRMLKNIANLGSVPKSAYKRLAVCKGLIEQQDIPETAAIRFGNETEMNIFNMLHEGDERWQSNLRWESKHFSTENVKLITHPDFVLEDEKTRTITIVECKATKTTIERTRSDYSAQLYIHYVIGREIASERKERWKIRLLLAHYCTNGLDLSVPNEFDPKRLTIRPVKPRTLGFDLERAMSVVDSFLQTFDEYYDEVVEEKYLPQAVKENFAAVASKLAEIQRMQDVVEDFKQRLYTIMCEKGIKGITSDLYSITLVEPTKSVSFDQKRYIADLKEQHPRAAKKIIEKYTKTTERRGYVTFKLKTQDNN